MSQEHGLKVVGDCGCGEFAVPGQFCVNTEGNEHPWDCDSITPEQIARLGGWDPAQGVIQVFEDNTERTLAPGEIVHLKPGHAFCRRVRWKRGFTRAERVTAEIDLLKATFPGVQHLNGWVLIPGVVLPDGWTPNPMDVAFQIADAFPGAPPYGIYVRHGLRFRGNVPQNYTDLAPAQPPFGGQWGQFSWTVAEASDWRPGSSVSSGPNLCQWVRGFAQRFAEGL